VQAVEGQDHHDDEVRDKQRSVKPVPLIKVLEGVVAIVVAQIVAQVILRLEERERLHPKDHGRDIQASQRGCEVVEQNASPGKDVQSVILRAASSS
jgi:hypothetical protein